ncbi:MAG: NAD(P)/FAD-dependent oxidoreductase [Tepidibacter sp.]|jgi:predicted Rossmann fold flavoprotein|uniref:NAD(P)/FAD-dependent oxidoreductase n=1 Tax=Tepidibacter sp. TaxID=2529387 RepID=UPI0025D15ABB|nr:NAD(P)/FAD-dependent oxidoreductase [Tepidibacter sp.]MCT4509208.1 NAD(P)/FAD-dependent oxidoreductase [Tepidibacter sp.]
MSKVIVIGAGPAGMMSAIAAARNNEVILIEKNKELGKKLKITGGGRCNITNKRDIEDFLEKIIKNPKFLYSSLYTFTNIDLLDFFIKRGIKFKIEEDFKVYPEKDKSDVIIKVLNDELNKVGVKVIYEKTLTDIIVEDEEVKGIILNDNHTIKADKVIIATGGHSYSKTGSDGKIHSLLKKYGENITKIYPALVPLVFSEGWIKNLQGISLKNIKVSAKYFKNKKISIEGDILFAHFGLTGPVILNLSSYINKYLQDGNIELKFDFVPNISKDEVRKIIRNNNNKSIYNNLKEILPVNFTKQLLEYLSINKKPNNLTKEEENKIVDSIKELKLNCKGTKSINEAIVTSGGISVKSINSSTMESKSIKNLHYAGEIIDIEGLTGGYNLQIAFSTGYLAGISV